MQLATAIVDVARTLARSVPVPRGAPYFYLDVDAAYDLRVFDSLSTRGIFRKYEFALDLGSSFGGRARWLATRTGCSIVGIDPNVAAVRAATMLNRRAHMDAQVSFRVGRLEQLPLRERVFTHVWMLDVALPGDRVAMLTEAFRVLRRGGRFALQCQRGSATEQDGLVETLRATGFIEIETSDVRLAEVPDAGRIASERLQAMLRAHPDAEALLGRLAAPRHEPSRLQIFARRPA